MSFESGSLLGRFGWWDMLWDGRLVARTGSRGWEQGATRGREAVLQLQMVTPPPWAAFSPAHQCPLLP